MGGFGRQVTVQRGVSLVALLVLLSVIAAACGGEKESAKQTEVPSAAEGTLSTVQALVEWRGGSTGDWATVADTQTVTQGAAVRTDAMGQALLTLYSGTEVDILPGSEVMIDALIPTGSGAPRITLTQLRGETLHRVAEVADAEDGYVLNTPVAYLVVRGTVFGVQVAEDGATRVTVEQGAVQATIGEETFAIEPGQALDVTAQGTTAGPEPLRLPDPTPNPTPSVAAIQAPAERGK